MRVLHVIPYMSLRAGGPVVVVDRLCRQLAQRGVEPVVLTTDVLSATGPTEEDTRGNPGAGAQGGTPALGTYEVHTCRALSGRFAYSPGMAAALDRVVPACDLVHVHTLWTHATAAAARACRRHNVPYVLMPHGMLDPHSLERKRIRKLVYGRLFEFRRVRAARAILYTTDQERTLAERALGALPPGHIVPLGADRPPAGRAELAREFLASRAHLRSKRLVTFLGRVHPKKGLDLLIPAFARVVSRVPDAHLLVIGPEEAGAGLELQARVERAGLRPHMTRIDMLVGRQKWAALAASTLFVLPSYQENFAIAAAEALRMGTPVVLSNRVNIWREVFEAGAGSVVPCDPDALAAALDARLREPASRWHQMSQAAVRLAETAFDWSRSADALLQAYRAVLGVDPAHSAPAHRCATIEV